MKILITGANGMVARKTSEYCRSIGDETVALTRQQLDIADRKAVFDVFEREKFDAVINCAAYTDVDGAETNRGVCYKANAYGVENLALASKRIDAAFVTISTDYVFDGAKADFYTQRDTPNPLGVYAEAKLEGEIEARNAYARSIIVRTGWIYGAGGTNFLSVMHRLLAEGKSIKAISDSYGTPTFADDLARRLRELVELDLPAIFHVTNSGAGASYLNFAQKVCEINGYDENLLEIVTSDTLKRPAPRPQSSN
jgi:dTDP-4-dehydrorhamnose reductase